MNKINLRVSIVFFNVIVHFSALSQEHTKDILDNVSSNIISYNISQKLEGNIKENFILSREKPSFFKYIPNANGKLSLTIEKEDKLYPKEGFELYVIFHKNYEIEYDNFQTVINTVDEFVAGRGAYLIAYNEITQKIKYVSGDFFLSLISEDFILNKKVPETFIDYIRLRTFTLETVNIEYVKRNFSYLIFKAFSKQYNKDVYIYVKKSNPDILLIKTS